MMSGALAPSIFLPDQKVILNLLVISFRLNQFTNSEQLHENLRLENGDL